MFEASLIRSVRFAAAHHYRRPEWGEDENRRVFGENMRAHQHEYRVEVTVHGTVDEETGFLIDLGALDRAIEDVVGPLRGTDLAESIPEARSGGMLPSTENLARWFFGRLEWLIPAPAHLKKVRVAESDSLAAEFGAG